MIYLIWICLHYIASHLYVNYCTPSSLLGFIASPFLTHALHCQALRWCILKGADTINIMWTVLATTITSTLLVSLH